MTHRTGILAASILVIGGLVPLATAESEPIKLSDKSGREITATIILVTAEEVEIEMNGSKFTLPISRFSLSSQEVIRKYAADNAPEPEQPLPDFVDAPLFQFEDLDYKERKLDHFIVRTVDTGSDPADRYAERAYKLLETAIPDLTDIFEKQRFRAPREDANSNDFPEPDKRFRHHIYLVGDSDTYANMVQQYGEKMHPNERNRQNFVNGANGVQNFAGHQHRLTVIHKDGTPKENLLAHMIAFQLVATKVELPQIPFWLRMGAGYYSEHRLTNRCAVYYVNFDDYYESEAGVPSGAGNMNKAEILSNSEPWIKPIKNLCKNDKKVNLGRLCEVTSKEVTPNDSGYAMALFSFMVSTDERIKNFNSMMDDIKDGAMPGPQDFADAYGYASPEEFEAAWYEWILGSDFK